MSEPAAPPAPAAAEIATWFAVQQLHAEVARVLDAGDFARWPGFFTEDAMYLVQSRENFDRGLPLATMRMENRAMLRDRVGGATDTMFHDPCYQRHVVGSPVILSVQDGEVEAEAAYLVVRTQRDAMPELLSVGPLSGPARPPRRPLADPPAQLHLRQRPAAQFADLPDLRPALREAPLST